MPLICYGYELNNERKSNIRGTLLGKVVSGRPVASYKIYI